MTETPKEKIEELIEYYKEYEDSPQTEKCLQELLAYKETVTGIARMLGVTQYDISNKDAELLDVNLNDDAIKNALDRYRAADNTYLNKVTIMALNELLLYRQTKLTPDKVKKNEKRTWLLQKRVLLHKRTVWPIAAWHGWSQLTHD